MTMTDLIVPPPELVEQWWEEADQYQDDPKTYFDHVATEAARWGADQELDACCEWLSFYSSAANARELRAARRPKPPTLKEQALEALNSMSTPTGLKTANRFDTIRRALEALDD